MYAIGFKNGFVGLCNSDLEPQMQIFQAHDSSLTSLDLSPLTNMIATTSKDKTAKIWYIMRGPAQCKHTLQFHGTSPVMNVSFSANDPVMVTYGKDSRIVLQNYKTESELYSVQLKDCDVIDITHSPTARMFAYVSSECMLSVWEYGSI